MTTILAIILVILIISLEDKNSQYKKLLEENRKLKEKLEANNEIIAKKEIPKEQIIQQETKQEKQQALEQYIKEQKEQQQALSQRFIEEPKQQQERENEKKARKEKEQKNIAILVTGAICIVLSAIVFLMSTWNTIPNILKTVVLSLLTLVFFGGSYIAKEKFELDKASQTFFS